MLPYFHLSTQIAILGSVWIIARRQTLSSNFLQSFQHLIFNSTQGLQLGNPCQQIFAERLFTACVNSLFLTRIIWGKSSMESFVSSLHIIKWNQKKFISDYNMLYIKWLWTVGSRFFTLVFTPFFKFLLCFLDVFVSEGSRLSAFTLHYAKSFQH